MKKVSKFIALITLVMLIFTTFGNVLTADQTFNDNDATNQVSDSQISDNQTSGSQSNGYEYYYDKVNIDKARNMLAGKKLDKAYVVVLDSGIQQDYYNDFSGDLIAGARSNPEWGGLHATPWTSYEEGGNHGTEVQYVIDEMLYRLNTRGNIQTISYKYADADGKGSPERLLYALNDIMDHYVIEKKMNIVAINYSNWLDFYKTDDKAIIARQEELKQEIQAAIDRAASMGITFITTSGNDNKEASTYNTKLNNAIVVGATDINDKRGIWEAGQGITEGSNYGSQVDVVAPGVNVNVLDYKSDYRIGNGTSYSAPMVTALAAVLKSVNPKLSTSDIESIIKNTAGDIGRKGKDDEVGYGLIDYEKAIKAALPKEEAKIEPIGVNASYESINAKHTALVNQNYFVEK